MSKPQATLGKTRYVCASFQTVEEVNIVDEYMQDGIVKKLFNTVWYYNYAFKNGEIFLQYKILIYVRQPGVGWLKVTAEHTQLNSIRFTLNERAVKQMNDSAMKRYRALHPYVGKYEFPRRHATNQHPIFPYGDR